MGDIWSSKPTEDNMYHSSWAWALDSPFKSTLEKDAGHIKWSSDYFWFSFFLIYRISWDLSINDRFFLDFNHQQRGFQRIWCWHFVFFNCHFFMNTFIHHFASTSEFFFGSFVQLSIRFPATSPLGIPLAKALSWLRPTLVAHARPWSCLGQRWGSELTVDFRRCLEVHLEVTNLGSD